METPGPNCVLGPSRQIRELIRRWLQIATDDVSSSLLSVFNLAYVEASARAHNKLVHSLNGNIFTSTIAQVDQAPDTKSMMASADTSRPAIPNSTNNLILVNVASSYVPSALQQTTGLSLEYNERMNLSVIAIRPRKLEFRVMNVQLHDYYLNTLRASVLSREVTSQIQNAGFYNTRETDMTQAGFSLTALVDIGSFVNITGVSLERPVVCSQQYYIKLIKCRTLFNDYSNMLYRSILCRTLLNISKLHKFAIIQ